MFETLAETERDAATAEAFRNPKAGQRFSEMYSFYMYVVDVRANGEIVTREGNPPITFPEGAVLRVHENADAWRKRFSYNSIPGYWVSYIDDTQDVTGWA